jgi:hypothetical protein
MVVVRGRLTPEAGAVLMQALAAAREALYQRTRRADAHETGRNVSAETFSVEEWGTPQTPSMEQQQADALALLAETALRHGVDPGEPGERYQVVVHVDAAVLADTGRKVVPRHCYPRSRSRGRCPTTRSRSSGPSMRHSAGLHLHANTTRPLWAGERVDVGWAVGVLHPRALEPA